MTMDELKALDKPVITPKIAAQFLCCDPYYISIAARDCLDRLGFPVCRIGNRTKIPRLAFIRFLETGGQRFEDKQKDPPDPGGLGSDQNVCGAVV